MNAFLWGGTGRNSDAVASYKEAIRIFPKHADAYTNMGISYANMQQDVKRLVLGLAN